MLDSCIKSKLSQTYPTTATIQGRTYRYKPHCIPCELHLKKKCTSASQLQLFKKTQQNKILRNLAITPYDTNNYILNITKNPHILKLHKHLQRVNQKYLKSLKRAFFHSWTPLRKEAPSESQQGAILHTFRREKATRDRGLHPALAPTVLQMVNKGGLESLTAPEGDGWEQTSFRTSDTGKLSRNCKQWVRFTHPTLLCKRWQLQQNPQANNQAQLLLCQN